MKIDVHWHYMPEEFVQEIRREDNPWQMWVVAYDDLQVKVIQGRTRG